MRMTGHPKHDTWHLSPAHVVQLKLVQKIFDACEDSEGRAGTHSAACECSDEGEVLRFVLLIFDFEHAQVQQESHADQPEEAATDQVTVSFNERGIEQDGRTQASCCI